MTPGCRAAVAVAESLGLATSGPVVIHDTNHTVVWLRPHAVVAKVSPRADRDEALVREHRLGVQLTALRAAVAAPLPMVDPVRDPETGLLVSLWRRLDVVPGVPESAEVVGRSLHDLHLRLAQCTVVLPSFRVGLRRARAVLDDDGPMAMITRRDRALLQRTFDRLLPVIDRREFREVSLHGEPHAGNYLSTSAGLRWIDFEDACRGPVEWDVAFLPAAARHAFAGLDTDLVWLLETVNSARVATWCWSRADDGGMRQHAEHHMAIIRSRSTDEL